jgi:hypothetical protein
MRPSRDYFANEADSSYYVHTGRIRSLNICCALSRTSRNFQWERRAKWSGGETLT